MSCPSTATFPSLGLTMPQITPMSVVLPAPLGPSRAKISPRRISRSTLLSASRPEAKVLESFETEMIDGMRGRIDAAAPVGIVEVVERALVYQSLVSDFLHENRPPADVCSSQD